MAAQNQEADALKSTIAASGRGGSRPEPPDKKKKAKDVQDTIAGKRLLKMSVARQLCPPGSYLYQTTDGRKLRIFFGKRRESTSALISIGEGLALLHCVRWAWTLYELGGGGTCPYDLTKIKIKDNKGSLIIALAFFYNKTNDSFPVDPYIHYGPLSDVCQHCRLASMHPAYPCTPSRECLSCCYLD